MSLTEELGRHVAESMLRKSADEAPAIDADLSRVLDSMQFMLLARHVEDTYRIEIEDDEISLDHFGSLQALAAFIQRKRG